MKKNQMFIAFAMIMLLSFVTPLVADAYNHWTNKAKLTGGVYYRTFYTERKTLDHINYGSLVREAVADWNDRVNGSVDVYFTEINSNHSSQARFWAGGYGNTGWNGVALFFTYNDGPISTEDSGPKKNYEYSQLKLNHTYLVNDSVNDIRATIKHEFGHALGLAHSGELHSIMYKNRNRTTRFVQPDDITGVKNLYQ